MLSKKMYEKGIKTLLAVFGNMNTSKEKIGIWYDLLADTNDEDFENAIRKICTEVRDIYPGTNIVALIREQITQDDGIKIL